MSDPLRIELDPINVGESDIAFLGCSYTFGTGLPADATRYSKIVAEHYGKNELNLSKGGTGNYRSFDIFSHIVFEPGASLVLQLAELSRVRWYNDQVHDQQLSVKPDRNLLHVYNDKFLIYDLIKHLRIIVNSCRAHRVKLVLWSNIGLGVEELDNALELYLAKFPEYVYLEKRLGHLGSYRVDNGLDGYGKELGVGHPGPESNKIIAQRLIEHFDRLYK